MSKNKKSILMLLVMLLFVLLMPCSVKAEDEPLGYASVDPKMMIMYARNDETDDKKGIAIYSFEDNSIKIENANEEEIANPIEGLTVSFDESNESFIITLEEGANINLEAYFTNEQYYSMIHSPCDLKIVGNGTLTMTALSKPSTFEQSNINAFIYVERNVYIGDESTHPTINFKSNLNPNDEHPYVELEGIMGGNFCLQNANIYAELKNYVFVNLPLGEENVPDNSQSEMRNMLVIDHSTVRAKYKKLNEHDNEQTLCGIINIQPMHHTGNPDTYREGNILITNQSELDYKCDIDNVIDMPNGSYAIGLYGESGIIIEDSKVSFNSNSKLNFCDVLRMLVISFDPSTYCTSVSINQKQVIDYPLIKTNILEIFDSKFRFNTNKGPVFDLKEQPIIEEEAMRVTNKTTPLNARHPIYPLIERPENVNSYIYISESDENIEGIMEIKDGNVFPYIPAVPARLSLLQDAPTRISSSKYDWVHIESCGRAYPIKNIGARSEYLDPDIKKDGKIFHIFDFNVYEDSDDKLKASEFFNITKEPDNDNPHHIVLNTGIN